MFVRTIWWKRIWKMNLRRICKPNIVIYSIEQGEYEVALQQRNKNKIENFAPAGITTDKKCPNLTSARDTIGRSVCRLQYLLSGHYCLQFGTHMCVVSYANK